jgi:serine/threonine-protein kinase NIM1
VELFLASLSLTPVSSSDFYGHLSRNVFKQKSDGVAGLDVSFSSIFTEKVAIKILDKTKLDQKTQRLLSREISSMERLRHPNIIRLYEVVETLAKLHIVMEYAPGGELFTKISNEGKMSEKDAKPIFAQVVAALEHMVRLLFISIPVFKI